MDYRKLARQWRASSKARAKKLGLVLPLIPTIDEVEAHLKAASHLCCYCSLPFGAARKTNPNMDHAVPLSRGGGADLPNFRLCCRACNHAKGPLLESEFRDLLALIKLWDDRGNSLLVRLRGGYWCYRPIAQT